MSLLDLFKLLIGDNSLSGGRYPIQSPKNLHGHIESVDGDSVTYEGSSGTVTGTIAADEGESIVVRDDSDGWLRLWK